MSCVERYALNEPFGMAPPEEDPDGNGVPFTLNLRFPGQYFDKETNLAYNYYRDYDPSTGRYIQSDPIGLQGGINTYTYVGGNPLGVVDPNGLAGIRINGVPIFVPGNGSSSQSSASGTGNSVIDDALRGGKGSSSSSAGESCPPPPPEDPCDKKLSDELLRDLDIDAHEIKRGLLGSSGWGAYNLCGCKDGRIVLKRSSNCKGPGGEYIYERWK